MSQLADKPFASPTFERDAAAALHLVRDAFARIIEHKCPRSKAVTTLTQAFGIHRKLAWQIGKVAYGADPFVAARHMPTPRGISAWLDAAATRGVPAPMVDSARHAAAQFETITSAHASSRTELEMLLESCSVGNDGAAESHLKWRQQMFNGTSFVWGAYCKVLLALMVMQPSAEKPHHFHIAQIRGMMNFRQTRAGVRWTVNQSVVADDSSRTETALRRAPLDPAGAKAAAGVPVITRFCSDPMPAMSRRVAPDGIVYDEIVPGPVGQSGERTLVTGELLRNIGPDYATEQDRVAHFGTAVRIPSELLHMDLFVHRSLFGPVERELRVFSDLTSPIAFEEADALPAPERISRLGRGIALAHSPDIPAYADLASWVFGALAADPDDYELYRVRMPYPPMPVSVMFRHELLPRASAR